MRIAYADPPYPGQAQKHYSHDPLCAEVDHVELIGRLCSEFPDGWGLSTSSTALEYVLDCCKANGLRQRDKDYRIGAWVKPFASFKPGVNPAYTWEPVVYRGGRGKRERTEPTVRDFATEDCVKANITLKKGLAGAKPTEFCLWLFRLMGMQEGDELVDLYPGTGIVSSTWTDYLNQLNEGSAA